METRNETPIVAFTSIHPGEIIHDWLDDVGIKQEDFAKTIDLPASRLNELIKGKRALTEDDAQRLSNALGMPSAYWLKLQADYEYNERMLSLRDEELGIDPHIAVARYKHDSNQYSGKAYATTKIV